MSRCIFAALLFLLWGVAIALFSGADSVPSSDPMHYQMAGEGLLVLLLSLAVAPFTFDE